MTNKIFYIDDGLGAIISAKEFIGFFPCSYRLLIDNLNFPYAIRNNIKKLIDSCKDLGNSKNFLTTNPAIGLNLGEDCITGLKFFYQDLKDGGLVISNKYFNDFLRERRKSIDLVDGQLLSNQVQIFTTPDYIIDNILNSYIKDQEDIYFMDTNFYVLKDYIYKKYPRKNIKFIQDYIKDQLKDQSFLGRDRLEIYLTGYRKGVYLDLEDKYRQSFIKIREINF